MCRALVIMGVFWLLAMSYFASAEPQMGLQARTISAKITAAVNSQDNNALAAESFALLSSRTQYSNDEFASLIFAFALAYNHQEAKDPAQGSNAYFFMRAARESLIDTDPTLQAALIPLANWYPESHNREFDERTFQSARYEETELRLRLWRQFDDAYAAALAGGKPKMTSNRHSPDKAEREQYSEQEIAQNHWQELVFSSRKKYTRPAISAMAIAYQKEPVDFDELRGLVEHHMNGSKVTNAWDSIVAQLPEKFKRQAAVAYAKPPVLTARASLLPPIVPPARGEPGLPAVARPSKLREALGVRGGSGAVAPEPSGKSPAGVESAGGGAGEAGGRSVWPWVGLGLAALAGGFIWLRAR